jgi:hypothetical protein
MTMLTTKRHTVAVRATALLGAFLTLAGALAAPAAAEMPPAATEAAAPAAPAGDAAAAGPVAPAANVIYDARAWAGYETYSTDGDRSLLYPYQSLDDTAVLGLDLLYLTPGFGTLRLEADWAGQDSNTVEVEYNHGADLDLKVDRRAFTHAREHRAPVADSTSVAKIKGLDEDPGATYRDDLTQSNASVRYRIPNYPAHLRASGRIATHKGTQQMGAFTRNCTTSTCHVNVRSRELDQETQDYTLGLDAHVGPVDVAYTHAAQTYRDTAPDPIVFSGGVRDGPPAGFYPHDVNPDLRSFSDSLSMNTALANRVVLSLNYTGGEQENESGGVTTRTRTGGGQVSWRPAAKAFFLGRYQYDELRTAALSAHATDLRNENNALHAEEGFNHQHALDPESTRHTGELTGTFTPLSKLDLSARLRYRSLSRYAILEKEGDAFVDESKHTTSTLAAVSGRYRPGQALAFDGSFGWEWTDGPVYAIETTGVYRYGLGATWTPAPIFLLRASWQGYRGKNDDAEALRQAYAAEPTVPADPERTISGDALMLTASFVPAPEFTLTASWGLTDNGVEQDMIFGSPDVPANSFLSADTPWNCSTNLASLRARWAATKRLALTAEGLWIDSLEKYSPTFPLGAGLEKYGTVDFTKLMGSLAAELRLSDMVGLTLSGFWARYEDHADSAGDGTVEGAYASVDVRW